MSKANHIKYTTSGVSGKDIPKLERPVDRSWLD